MAQGKQRLKKIRGLYVTLWISIPEISSWKTAFVKTQFSLLSLQSWTLLSNARKPKHDKVRVWQQKFTPQTVTERLLYPGYSDSHTPVNQTDVGLLMS